MAELSSGDMNVEIGGGGGDGGDGGGGGDGNNVQSHERQSVINPHYIFKISRRINLPR